jgi:hypothetical protein
MSNSIINQQKILRDFANKNGFTNIQHFSDDGFSGTNWERPGWKALIAEIEAGNVGAVIVKDMSRVGRDYLQVGFYTEVMFRKHNVRFIAVGNNIDSDNKESTEFAPFLNLMSEWYARDCSRKIKTVLHAKGNNGKHMTSKPIYGYKRLPDDKDLWIVDDESALVVRRIFQMAMDGLGSYQIARVLTEERVEKPSYYASNPKPVYNDPLEPYIWRESTIREMLAKPEYAGHTVNFRTSRESYKDKVAKINAKEDWKVFLNTHEQLIEQSVFDTVQKLLGTPRRIDNIGVANPLTGLMFCGSCGGKMHNHRTTKSYDYDYYGKRYTNKPTDSYNCSTYKQSSHRFNTVCSNHHISTKVVRELILDSIRNICGYVRHNQAEFVEKIREESVLHRGETAKSHKKAIAKNEKRIAELESLFRRIYEDNAKGGLSNKRFKQMSADYESEQAILETKNAEMQAELKAFNSDSDKIESFIELVKRYTEFEELTTSMLNEFVDKIFIHKAVKTEFERVQQIDIHFNFIGNFKLPIAEVEPTAEEIVAEEKRRENVRKRREACRRWREKKKAELAEIQAEEIQVEKSA